jgi:hypothetical protein
VWTAAPSAFGISSHSAGATTQAYDPNLHTAISDCTPSKVDVLVEENPIPTTTNQSPVNPTTVLGMTKSVKVGGSTATCLMANVTATAFSGHPTDQPYDVLYLSVWLDGHVGHPAEYQFSADDGLAGGTRAANFVFKKVNPGVHTVSMKMWTAFGSPSGVTVPTMEILHS